MTWDGTTEVWDCTNDEYHADRLAVSSSTVKLFKVNREKFALHLAGKLPRKETPEMRFGALLHSFLFDDAEFVRIPKSVLTSNGQRRGKKWDDFAAENDGKALTSDAEYVVLDEMRIALSNHPVANVLLSGGDVTAYEQAIRWTDPDTGIRCKCRPDALGKAIADLKTCVSADPKSAAEQITRLRYDWQASLYARGVARLRHDVEKRPAAESHLPFIFVFIEKEPPYTVRCYDLPPSWMEEAHDEVGEVLWQMGECIKLRHFHEPGWDQIVSLQPPRWRKYANEYALEEV